MFDIKKLKNTIKSKKNRGQKALILSAAMASLVASGETDGTGGTGGGGGTAPILDNNSLIVSVEENQSVVLSVPATDTEKLTFEISGDDAKFFNIDAGNGTLTFIADPNFESPADADADNVYNIDVKVTNESGKETTGNAVVTVTNVNEAVSFADASTLAVNAAENQTAVATVAATDIDGDVLSYSLTGTDAKLFDISAVGVISFKAAPDFETKADDGANGVYNVTVTASDAGGLNATRDVEITVTDQNEAPSFADGTLLAVSVAENQTAVTTVAATDSDGDKLTYTLSGADADLFDISSITGAITFKAAPDFETKADADADGVYKLTVIATDDAGLSAAREVSVSLTNVNEGVSFASSSTLAFNVAENQLAVATVAATDLDGDVITYSLSGQNANKFSISSTGVVTLNNYPDFENPDYDPKLNNYLLTVNATDGEFSDTQDVEVTLTDVLDPVVNLLNTPYKSGAEFLVNSSTESYQNFANVTQLASGGYVITWETGENTSFDHGDASGDSIRYQVFTKEGTTIGDERTANSTVIGNQENPYVAALNDGGFAIVYTTENIAGDADKGVMLQKFDLSGDKSGAEIHVNTTTANNQSATDLLVLKNGNIAITWTSFATGDNDIVTTIITPSGTTVTAEFVVNTTTAESQSLGKMTELINGNLVYTWQSGTSRDIKATIIDPSVGEVLAEFTVNNITSNNQETPSVAALATGGFVIAWHSETAGTSNDNLMMQIYTADGTPKNNSEDLVVSDLAGHQRNADIIGLESGGFVVSWQDQGLDNAYAKVFDSHGTLDYGAIQLNSFDTANQTDVSIASLGGSRFIATWRNSNISTETGGDDSFSSMKAQIFDMNSVLKAGTGGSLPLRIEAVVDADQTGASITSITVEGLPTGISATTGGTESGGVWTFAPQEFLLMSMDSAAAGVYNLVITAHSDDGKSSITEHSLILSNSISGTVAGDEKTASLEADGFFGGLGADIYHLAGAKADYSFELEGNDLRITENANSQNSDFLNSVETINFDGSSEVVDVTNLLSDGDISGISADDFSSWLTYNYDLS